MAQNLGPQEWVFLTYALPRTPSAPRLALWRRLKRLGVVQLSDGLVALPADARTREQLEWAADEAIAAGGTAGVWLTRPTTRAQGRQLGDTMNAARTKEYATLACEAQAAMSLGEADRARALRRLRAEQHRIGRRDFFRPRERERARQALAELAATLGVDTGAGDPQVAR